MLTFLKNVFKKGELRRKVIFTLGILFVYRLGAGITIPGVDVGSLSRSDATNGIFGIMNLLGGGTLERFSLFALGVSPYITSSIIIELLSMDVIPALTRWRKEGNTGKKKKDRVTRVLTLLLAALQGGVLTYAFDTSYNILVDSSIWSYIYVVLIMMAGSMFAIWLGDQITQKGIGNGTSVIIMAGIIATLPTMFMSLWNELVITTTVQTTFLGIAKFLLFVLLYVAILVGIVFVETAERRIPIQYANKSASIYGKQQSYIPFKLNSSSVMPVIFASMLLSIPTILSKVINNDAFTLFVNNWLTTSTVTGFIIYVVCIFVFAYFYTFLQLKPKELAENLNQNGGFIPGIRPGEETEKYISKILKRITTFGAISLAIIACIPIIFGAVSNLSTSVSIGGTGLLIVVGVALETYKQIESELVTRNYQTKRRGRRR